MTWPVSLLKSEGILRDALTHVQAGREFHFVSTLKSGDLDALSDVARRSNDYERFDAHLDSIPAARRDAFNVLAGEWGGSRGHTRCFAACSPGVPTSASLSVTT